MPFWEKSELRKVAKENYQIVKHGGYVDVHGNKHALRLPRDAPNRTREAPQTAGRRLAPRFETTRLCVANMDTATAARAMAELGKPAACLNFANQYHRGGGYLNGAHAQEEDLCRLMPPLYSSLGKLRYPMKDGEAHFTRTLLARTAGTYSLDGPPLEVDVISAAMPNLGAVSLDPRSEKWVQTVKLRIRAVLHAAREAGSSSLILGAFGCGAFHNPPDQVAHLFKSLLNSDEFRGDFETVVFAILQPKPSDAGNFAAFADALCSLCK
jgi:uncharacterized protein (TIGR02452 family)